MKKFIKIAVVVVAVLLAAALIAPMAFRGRIAETVKREANSMLRARLDFGALDISLLRHFPHASLELKELTLVGTGRFEGDTIAAAGRISVVVDLLSLFGDEGFEVTKIYLSDARLHARKHADGAVNWDVLEPAEPHAAPKDEQPQTTEPSAFRLSVRDFRIARASIRYEDDSTRTRFSASPVDLRLRGDLSERETDLDLRLGAQSIRLVSGSVTLLSGAEAELNAAIAADLANRRFEFAHNRLRLNAVEVTLDGWVEMRDEALAVDIATGCEKVQFKDVLSLVPAFYTRDFRSLSASGELSLSLWARGEMRGSALPAFELNAGVRNGSFQYSSLPKAVTDINLAARVSNPGGVMDKTVAELSKCSFRMAGNTLSATFRATNLVSDPVFRATADGRIDLSALKEVYPLERGIDPGGVITADVRIEGRMSDVEKLRYERIAASGTFVVEELGLTLPELPAVHIRRAAATVTPQTLTLGDFGMTVGRSDIAANGQLSGYLGYLLKGERLSGRLYVKSDLLDLNELMAALPASEDSSAGEQAARTPEAEPRQTLAIPANLNLSLNTELHRILLNRMTITDLGGEMRTAGGVLSLDRLAMRLFGGKASASGRYSTADPARPVVRLSVGLSGASFSKTFDELEMVQRLVPVFAKTGGDYSLSMDLSAKLGAGMEPDMQSVNATGELRSANIRVQNIEAFDALARALGDDDLRRIEAKDVAIRFTIRDGRVATQPFDLKLGGTSINLSGSTGLDQTIDYVAKVKLPVSLTGGVTETLNVKIGGTYASPKITLGVKEAARQAIQGVIEEQIEKFTGGGSLAEAVSEQADRIREEARRAGEKLVAAAEAQRDRMVAQAAEKGALAKLAAEKAGDMLVAEARKQAEKLTAEAEKQIEKLTAEKK